MGKKSARLIIHYVYLGSCWETHVLFQTELSLRLEGKINYELRLWSEWLAAHHLLKPSFVLVTIFSYYGIYSGEKQLQLCSWEAQWYCKNLREPWKLKMPHQARRKETCLWCVLSSGRISLADNRLSSPEGLLLVGVFTLRVTHFKRQIHSKIEAY